MNKQNTLIAAAALAALLGLGGCSGAASNPTPAPTAPAMTMAPDSMAPDSMAPDSMAGMIHIESGAFRDATPVAAGAMVTVMNMDDTACTVMADDGSFTVDVPAGGMAAFMAPAKAGTYAFHSSGNADMQGTLTVR